MTDYTPFKNCTEECAKPVPCPDCGKDLAPFGRDTSPGRGISPCCDKWQNNRINTRHIWSIDELEEPTDD